MELKAYRETDRKTKIAVKYGKCCNRQLYRTALAPKMREGSVASWSEEVQRFHCGKTFEWVLKDT